METENLTKIVLVLVNFAAITKRAQLPFFSWLPAAIAPPMSSLVHFSILVTAGVYFLNCVREALLIAIREFLINYFSVNNI